MKKGFEYAVDYRKNAVVVTKKFEMAASQWNSKDLLVNRLNLNSQVDAVDFANFIIALSLIEGFDKAPWPVRADTMYNYTGKYVAESTLRGWASKLIATGNAIKEGKDEVLSSPSHRRVHTQRPLLLRPRISVPGFGG